MGEAAASGRTTLLPSVLLVVGMVPFATVVLAVAYITQFGPGDQGVVAAAATACTRVVAVTPMYEAAIVVGWLLVLWGVLAGLLTIARLAVSLVLNRRIGGLLARSCDEVELPLDGEALTVRVLAGRPTPAAFVVGLLRPRIYLGEELVRSWEPDELAVLLRHEHAHAKRRDPLRRSLVVASCHRLVPGAGALAARYLQNLEIQADASAIRDESAELLIRAIHRLSDPASADSLVLRGASICGFGEPDQQLRAIRGGGNVRPLPGRSLLFATLLVGSTLFASVGITAWEFVWRCPEPGPDSVVQADVRDPSRVSVSHLV